MDIASAMLIDMCATNGKLLICSFNNIATKIAQCEANGRRSCTGGMFDGTVATRDGDQSL